MYKKHNDALDALIVLAGDALIEKNLQTDLLNGAPLVKRPKSLDKKIARMIQHERRKPYNEVFVIMKQTAAVFLVVCTLMFAMAMSVDAVREAFWNAVVEWFDKYISVVYETEVEPLEKIEEYKEPQLVPVGAERVIRVMNDRFYIVDYYIDKHLIFTYQQTIINTKERLYDNNVDNVSEIIINDNKVYITYYNNDRHTLCWTDTKYLYEIYVYGILSPQTTIDIVTTLK